MFVLTVVGGFILVISGTTQRFHGQIAQVGFQFHQALHLVFESASSFERLNCSRPFFRFEVFGKHEYEDSCE